MRKDYDSNMATFYMCNCRLRVKMEVCIANLVEAAAKPWTGDC